VRGHVLQAATAEQDGAIVGSDGNRYAFSTADWKGTAPVQAGEQVDFVAGDTVALEIFPLPAGVAGAQTFAAAATAAAAGAAGGATSGASAAGGGSYPASGPPRRPPASSEGSSVALGIIGILCLLLGFIVPVLPTIVALIVGLVGADSAKRHNNDNGMILSRIAWIGAVILLGLMVVAVVLLATFAWPLLDLIWQIFVHIYNEEQAKQALALIAR
jgi:hypothetical protein